MYSWDLTVDVEPANRCSPNGRVSLEAADGTSVQESNASQLFDESFTNVEASLTEGQWQGATRPLRRLQEKKLPDDRRGVLIGSGTCCWNLACTSGSGRRVINCRKSHKCNLDINKRFA